MCELCDHYEKYGLTPSDDELNNYALTGKLPSFKTPINPDKSFPGPQSTNREYIISDGLSKTSLRSDQITHDDFKFLMNSIEEIQSSQWAKNYDTLIFWGKVKGWLPVNYKGKF